MALWQRACIPCTRPWTPTPPLWWQGTILPLGYGSLRKKGQEFKIIPSFSIRKEGKWAGRKQALDGEDLVVHVPSKSATITYNKNCHSGLGEAGFLEENRLGTLLLTILGAAYRSSLARMQLGNQPGQYMQWWCKPSCGACRGCRLPVKTWLKSSYFFKLTMVLSCDLALSLHRVQEHPRTAWREGGEQKDRTVWLQTPISWGDPAGTVQSVSYP